MASLGLNELTTWQSITRIVASAMTDGWHASLHCLPFPGPFLLTDLLLDTLKSSAPARIINTAALAYQLVEFNMDDINWQTRDYVAGDAYAQSKMSVILWTQQLGKELEGRTVYWVHYSGIKLFWYSTDFWYLSLANIKWLLRVRRRDHSVNGLSQW